MDDPTFYGILLVRSVWQSLVEFRLLTSKFLPKRWTYIFKSHSLPIHAQILVEFRLVSSECS